MRKYATGGNASLIDLRDFTYIPQKSNQKGGKRYLEKDIEDQFSVGVCTAISLTQNAGKALDKKYSADFQYLLQKKYYDGNWTEGSSARSALSTARKYGFLLEKDWERTTLSDRTKGYEHYIKKLQNISDEEIGKLLKKAEKNKVLTGYSSVAVDRDLIAKAIDESKAGVLVRFVIGNEWFWEPIEPLRASKMPISGHIITISNYDGMSYRVANTWGKRWCNGGTAYGSLLTYQPTEVWLPYYIDTPEYIEEKQKELKTLQWQVIGLLQKIINLLQIKK